MRGRLERKVEVAGFWCEFWCSFLSLSFGFSIYYRVGKFFGFLGFRCRIGMINNSSIFFVRFF